MTHTGSVSERVRQRNLAALLRHVHLQGSATRTVLAERLRVNRSTILTLSRELAGAGLVHEESPAERVPRAGRPSLVVRPNSGVYVLAFDIRADRFTAARVQLGGHLLDRYESPIDVRPSAAARTIAQAGRLLMRAAVRGSVCAGVGVAIPGPARGIAEPAGRIAGDGGAAQENLLAGLRGARLLPPYRGRPFRIGHDANLAVIAEHRRGAGTGHQNLVYLQGRDGLRGGVMVAGEPIGGVEGCGVDIGHLIITPGGRACHCGARGCMEVEFGSCDERSAPRVVGAGLAKLLDLFAPEMVIFGDGLAALHRSAAGEAQARPHDEPSARIRFAGTALGDTAVLVGAAELAFSVLLADPIRVISSVRKWLLPEPDRL